MCSLHFFFFFFHYLTGECILEPPPHPPVRRGLNIDLKTILPPPLNMVFFRHAICQNSLHAHHFLLYISLCGTRILVTLTFSPQFPFLFFSFLLLPSHSPLVHLVSFLHIFSPQKTLSVDILIDWFPPSPSGVVDAIFLYIHHCPSGIKISQCHLGKKYEMR